MTIITEDEHYIQNIKVEEWLRDNKKFIKLNFKDRIEYRFNGKLHYIYDAAVQFKDGTKKYYINGVEYDVVKFKQLTLKIKRKKKLKEILS